MTLQNLKIQENPTNEEKNVLLDLLERFPPPQLKKSKSSKWAKTADLNPLFSWQNGYGAFSVGESAKENVINYILNQKEHYKKTPPQPAVDSQN